MTMVSHGGEESSSSGGGSPPPRLPGVRDVVHTPGSPGDRDCHSLYSIYIYLQGYTSIYRVNGGEHTEIES